MTDKGHIYDFMNARERARLLTQPGSTPAGTHRARTSPGPSANTPLAEGSGAFIRPLIGATEAALYGLVIAGFVACFWR